MLGNDDEEGAVKLGTHSGIHRRPWSKEEIDLALSLVKGGTKFADVADKLNRTFGNFRTRQSVQIRLWNVADKAKREGILASVQAANKNEGYSATPVA